MADTTSNSTASDAEAEAELKRYLDQGQWFLALDLAQTALVRSPGNLKLKRGAAHAMLSLGAAEEARQILEPMCVPLDAADPQVMQLFSHFRAAAMNLLRDAPGLGPSDESLATFTDLLDAVGRARERLTTARATDEETIGLLARAYKEVWNESGRPQDARRCRDMYLRAFRLAHGTWTCINAATMSWVVGETEAALGNAAAAQQEKALCQELAGQANELCQRQLATAKGEGRFWLLATQGEALLHLGREAEAITAYEQAAASMEVGDWMLASAARQLRWLRQWGFRVPERILTALRLPVVAVFVGHMIDRPGRNPPRFTLDMEAEVRRRIDQVLVDLKASIGYSMPACGSDLMFIEAMQDREATMNIVVPFDADDFIRTSVEFAGPGWVRRFRRAIKLAGEHVSYATTERYLGTPSLFGYADRILHGLALQQARSMGTEPYLVAVYDGVSPAVEGGTADVMERWPDKGRMRVVELPKPTGRVISVPFAPPRLPSQPVEEPIVPTPASRVIRSMLFADVVGFSKLREHLVPHFMYVFLNEVARHLRQLPVQPLVVNTWGDAIFAVMEYALPMLEYARMLRKVVCETDWKELGLPAEMNVRIGLHAGPVFEGTDAITNRTNFFGSHVNRAARIEPVTVPGHIYASQNFVALLSSEQRLAGKAAGSNESFTCEYLGRLQLDKKFDILPVYSIRSKFARSNEGE